MGRKKKKNKRRMSMGQDNWNFRGFRPQEREPVTYKPKESWHTGDEVKVAEDCSFCGKDKVKFYIYPKPWKAICYLLSEVKMEWQMLLCGRVEEGKFLITDYYIPKQEVTDYSVKNLDIVNLEVVNRLQIIASIHSHGNMKPFFSVTDKKDANESSMIANHIVINNDKDYEAIHRKELPCGLVKMVDAELIIISEQHPAPVGLDNIKVYKYGTHHNTIGWTTQDGMQVDVDEEKQAPILPQKPLDIDRREHAIDNYGDDELPLNDEHFSQI